MISIKTPKEIEIMRQGGKILASVLSALAKETKPGVATEWLNQLAEDLIFEKGALPAFKGYQGFPSALCVSINEQIVHGLPSKRKIKEGDVVGLDLGILFPPEHCGGCPFSQGCQGEPGMYTDAAISVGAGKEVILKEGMTLAIEPMFSAGGQGIKKGKDKYSFETKDGSIAAHFEHTIVVTKDGCEILTEI